MGYVTDVVVELRGGGRWNRKPVLTVLGRVRVELRWLDNRSLEIHHHFWDPQRNEVHLQVEKWRDVRLQHKRSPDARYIGR